MDHKDKLGCYPILKKSSGQAANGTLRGFWFLDRYRDLRATIFSKHPEVFPSQVCQTLYGSLFFPGHLHKHSIVLRAYHLFMSFLFKTSIGI